MNQPRKRRDVEVALAVLERAANDEPGIDALPGAKPLGHRVPYIAQALGGICERTVTNLLKAKKKPGVPKLEGWRIGKVWLSSDEQIEKYVDECKRVGRGEEIP